jgi:hypothetical protein
VVEGWAHPATMLTAVKIAAKVSDLLLIDFMRVLLGVSTIE